MSGSVASKTMCRLTASPQLPPSYLDYTPSGHFLLFNIYSHSVFGILCHRCSTQIACPCSQDANFSQPARHYHHPPALPLRTSSSRPPRWMWTSNNWIACLLICEYKLRREHMAHECIQQLTSQSVTLIYNSGSKCASECAPQPAVEGSPAGWGLLFIVAP